jgi:hypothetical protein
VERRVAVAVAVAESVAESAAESVAESAAVAVAIAAVVPAVPGVWLEESRVRAGDLSPRAALRLRARAQP